MELISALTYQISNLIDKVLKNAEELNVKKFICLNNMIPMVETKRELQRG